MKKWISTLSVYGDRHLHSFLAWFIAGVLLLAVITKFLYPLYFLKVIIHHSFVPKVFGKTGGVCTCYSEIADCLVALLHVQFTGRIYLYI